MSKLEKFNQIYNKVIYQSTIAEDQKTQQINTCDSFFKTYIQPLAVKTMVMAQKQRYNVFRISGTLEQICNFLDKFKVDKRFLKDNEQFFILSPMITFGQIQHRYNNGIPHQLVNRTFSEGNDLIDAGNTISTTRKNDDLVQSKLQGRWYSLFNMMQKNQNVPDFYIPKRVRKCTPKQLKQLVVDFTTKMYNDPTQPLVYLEFCVNCDKLANNFFDQLSFDSPITFGGAKKTILDAADRMNDTDKLIKPTAITQMPKVSENESLTGDTKKIIRNTKTLDYSKKNKFKRTKK